MSTEFYIKIKYQGMKLKKKKTKSIKNLRPNTLQLKNKNQV
jgi:hypothetical protein